MSARSFVFGYRVEGVSDLKSLAAQPFYYTKPRELDAFDKRAEIRPPEGMEAAGVWFFNSIQSLSCSGVKDYPVQPALISRIHVARMEGVKIVPDNLFNPDTASIAVAYYTPSSNNGSQGNGAFAHELSVPDELIDIWDGSRWVRKSGLGVVGMAEILWRTEWGKCRPPTPEEAAAHERFAPPDLPEEIWNPPPLAAKEQNRANWISLPRLLNRARHAGAIRRLKDERRERGKQALFHAQQAEGFREISNESGATIHQQRQEEQRAEITRAGRQITSLIEGKSFWETHDLDTWAVYAMKLETMDGSGQRLRRLFAELPDPSSCHELRGRIAQMKRTAERIRLAQYPAPS